MTGLAGRPARLPRIIGLVAVLMALGLSGIGTASAHDVLVSTSPADGSTVATLPAEVVLTFGEPALALGTQIVVTGPSGEHVEQGQPVLIDTTVRQALGPGPAGRYSVAWRVTSADGHPVSGTFAFTTTAASTGTTTPPTGATSGATSGSTPVASSPATTVAGAIAPVPTAGSGAGVGIAIAVMVAVVMAVFAVAVAVRRRSVRN